MGNIIAGAFGGAFIAVVIGLVIFWPFVLIWGLNTLFPVLAIPFTFWTWLATLVITMTFGRTSVNKKD
jgi:predicted lysophospholipase L1 biosynthesis ABC-type transport system permease subunit